AIGGSGRRRANRLLYAGARDVSHYQQPALVLRAQRPGTLPARSPERVATRIPERLLLEHERVRQFRQLAAAGLEIQRLRREHHARLEILETPTASAGLFSDDTEPRHPAFERGRFEP